MLFHKSLFSLSVVLLLNSFSFSSAEAAGTCRGEIDAYRGQDCRAFQKPGDQLLCFQRWAASIESFCGDNSEAKGRAKRKTKILLNTIADKSKIDFESSQYELAIRVSALQGVDNLLRERSENINSLRNEGVELYLNGKVKMMTLVEEFQEETLANIDIIKDATNADDLVAIEFDVQATYLDYAKKINAIDVSLALYMQSSVLLESSFMSSINNAYIVFDNLGLDADLKLRSKGVENMRKELSALESEFYSTTRRLVGFSRQQAALFRFNELGVENARLKREAFEVERIRSYFLEVDRLVQDVIKPVKSNYYHMPFLEGQIMAARELLSTAEMCRISDIPSWQSLGCERALAYETNASRVATTVAIATMNYASTRLFVNIDDESLAADINSLKLALGGNDVLASAQIYDSILSEL